MCTTLGFVVCAFLVGATNQMRIPFGIALFEKMVAYRICLNFLTDWYL